MAAKKKKTTKKLWTRPDAKSRGEVFKALQSDARYEKLMKAKERLAASITWAQAARDSEATETLLVAHKRLVRRIGKYEDEALKRAGLRP